jgi:hypothetical protein
MERSRGRTSSLIADLFSSNWPHRERERLLSPTNTVRVLRRARVERSLSCVPLINACATAKLDSKMLDDPMQREMHGVIRFSRLAR